MRVVSVTPAGRKKYIEVLVPYLLREKNRGTIDKHIFWVNTKNIEDINYLKSLTENEFFEVREIPLKEYNLLTICKFFSECIDKDALYIRIGDDICWIHEDAIKNIIRTRMYDPGAFLVYGNIVNNSICSHLHQRNGSLPESKGIAKYNIFDSVSWNSGKFSEFVHNNFIYSLNKNETEKFYINNWKLFPYLLDNERVSINVISWFGSTFSEFKGIVGEDEEQWLSVDKPKEIKAYNLIAGNALFCHFAYYTQREHLEKNTSLLNKYKEISQNI